MSLGIRELGELAMSRQSHIHTTVTAVELDYHKRECSLYLGF